MPFEPTSNLDNLRQEIDRLDRSLIEILKERLVVVEKIGQLKKGKKLPPLDESRWRAVLERRTSWAQELGVDEDFIKKVWELIHAQALNIEEHV